MIERATGSSAADERDAVDAERRIAEFARSQDPHALWPQLSEPQRIAAGRTLERAVRERLAGAPPSELDPRREHTALALGVAGHTTGVGPLIGWWLETGKLDAAADVREVFAAQLEHGRRRAARMETGALAAVDALAGAGITPVLLKGMHTARVYFDEPGVRRMSDVDLLVPVARTEDAERALAGAGFRARGEAARPYKRDWIAADVDPRLYSVERLDARSRWVVELQTSLDREFHPGAVAHLDRASELVEPFVLAGRRVLVPTPALLVAILACHCSQELDGTRLLRLYELVRVVRTGRAAGRLDWSPVRQILERTDSLRFAYPALVLAERLAPGTVDPAVLDAAHRGAGWAVRHTVARLVPAGGPLDGRGVVRQLMWVRGPRTLVRRLRWTLWPDEASRVASFAAEWRARWRRLRRGTLSLRAPDERDASPPQV